MKLMKLITLLGLGAMVSACANIETATRNAPFETTSFFETAQVQAMPFVSADPSFVRPQAAMLAPQITAINVNVPQSLKVSEANRYYPSSDIVWREDPLGTVTRRSKPFSRQRCSRAHRPSVETIP